MEEEKSNNPLKNLFDKSNSVLIVIPPDPDEDLFTASLSFHLSLAASGKQSQIGCSTSSEKFAHLIGHEQVQETIGNQNLRISFNYPEENLEKVDYDITPDGKFSLMIRPKEGKPVPSTNDVKFSYSGANSDLVVAFGINSLEELGKLYADEKKFLDGCTILSVNTLGVETTFTHNMFHLANVSFSELTCLLLQRLSLVPSPDAAKNLLNGIYLATDKLTSPKMNAETFASISYLMKSGAKLPFQTPSFTFGNPPIKPSFFESQPALQSTSAPVPPDWTAPKIFRANQSNPNLADKI